MPPICLLIKPASGNCNLKCTYCFYHSLAEMRQIRSYGMMDGETLELMVRKALEYADGACTFSFQGGEPTLAGLDFYRKLMVLEKKYNIKGVQINNSIQTNGVLINAEWAEFLAATRFLTGISLDGPKDIHDACRTGQGGKGSFTGVMEAAAQLDKYKAEYNILCVITSFTARHINKIYNFYKKHGFRYLQFIPCLDPLEEGQAAVPVLEQASAQDKGVSAHSLTPDRYAIFLKTLFDSWYADIIRGEMISIRYFDNIVGIAMGAHPEECGMSGICTCQFVVEADGSTFPCDFYVTDEWLLGNLKSDSFEQILKSAKTAGFIEVSRHTAPQCAECNWYGLCRGGCRRYREPVLGLNKFCPAYKEFFEYAGDRIYELARLFARMHADSGMHTGMK